MSLPEERLKSERGIDYLPSLPNTSVSLHGHVSCGAN